MKKSSFIENEFELDDNTCLELPVWEYEKIFNSCPVGIILLTVTGNVIKMNRLALKIFDKIPIEIESYCFFDLFPEHSKNLLETYVKDIKDGKAKNSLNLSFIQKNEEKRELKLIFNSYYSDFSTERVIQIIVLREKEDYLSENCHLIKNEFLSNVSHELRTPLNGIIGFIDILETLETNLEKIQILSIMRKSSENLLVQINEMLLMDKILQKNFKVSLEPLNVSSFIYPLIKTYFELCEEKNLTFSFHISENLKDNIIFDKDIIYLLSDNLLSNAIKFTEKGRIYLELLLEQSKLIIVVKDSGKGLTESEIGNLFLPFNQGEYFLKKRHGGIGLGLTIVKEITDLLSGIIDYRSSKEFSNEFYIIIPLD